MSKTLMKYSNLGYKGLTEQDAMWLARFDDKLSRERKKSHRRKSN